MFIIVPLILKLIKVFPQTSIKKLSFNTLVLQQNINILKSIRFQLPFFNKKIVIFEIQKFLRPKSHQEPFIIIKVHLQKLNSYLKLILKKNLSKKSSFNYLFKIMSLYKNKRLKSQIYKISLSFLFLMNLLSFSQMRKCRKE